MLWKEHIYLYNIVYIIDSPSKRPIPSQAKTWTVPEKSQWLHGEVKEFLKGIFLRTSDLAERADQLDAAHREGFHCRSQQCPAVFPLHSSIVRLVFDSRNVSLIT